jgi:hypothetical protein
MVRGVCPLSWGDTAAMPQCVPLALRTQRPGWRETQVDGEELHPQVEYII